MSTSSLSKEKVEAIARRYAPYLRFHPDEIYFMCNAEWFFNHSTLYGPNNTFILNPSIADLPVGDTDNGQYWLQMAKSVMPGDPQSAKVYLHATQEPGRSFTNLQYWFLSGYNGPGTLHISNRTDEANVSLAPLGEHWADWEMVMIRVENNTENVLGVYLSQHGEGEWITDLSRFERRDDQFVVYPSLNGHANYTRPGENPTHGGDYEIVSYYLRNATANNGKEFDCSTCIELVAADFIEGLVQPRWLRFPYRWGKGEAVTLSLNAVEKILFDALSFAKWLAVLLNPLVLSIAAVVMSVKSLDDTNGIYGPQTQAYWNDDLVPPYRFTSSYTNINTNRGNPPAVVLFRGGYHAYYQDEDGNGIMHAVSSDGQNWQADNYIGHNTSSGIAAVVFGDTIKLYYRDVDGNGVLEVTSANGRDFGDHRYIGVNIDGAPNAAVMGADRICVLGIDHNGYGIMYATWSTQHDWISTYTGQPTNRLNPPAITVKGDTFFCYYQEGDGNNGLMCMTSRDGISWTSPSYIGFNTSAGPCAVTLQDRIILLYRDPEGNGILYQDSINGFGFSHYMYTGLNCDYQPHAAGSDTGGTLLAIDHDGNGIMWLRMLK